MISHRHYNRFYAAIEIFLGHYQGAESRQQKGEVINAVYRSLRTQGRFVKTIGHPVFCEIVSETAAKSKIGHAIRYRHNQKEEARRNQQEDESEPIPITFSDSDISDPEFASFLGSIFGSDSDSSEELQVL